MRPASITRPPCTLSLLVGLFGLACSTNPNADDDVGTTMAMSTSSDDATSSSDDATSSSDDATSSSSDDATFQSGMDLGEAHCGPFDYEGCPGGEKCVPTSSNGWMGFTCVPIAGDGQLGEPCMGGALYDDCAAGLTCWPPHDVEAETSRICTALCTGSFESPACPAALECLTIDYGDNVAPLCLATCDPLLQDCPAGEGCYASLDGAAGFFCVFSQSPSQALGQPCGFVNDCAPGHVCSDAVTDCGADHCCAAYCDLANPSCGQPGTQCVALFEQGMAPAGHEDVGLCILP